MLLTDKQTDALQELINIAFARTAASLSGLSGHRVWLEVPVIRIGHIDELPGAVSSLMPGEVATVHQIFTGPVNGDALLLLNYEGAVMLTDLLTESRSRTGRLDVTAREALTEIGNILLNACLGTFGNVLKVQVSFAMPRLHMESVDQLLRSISFGAEELRFAVVVSTAFHVRESAVSGYLVIVLGVSSLDRLIRAIDDWEQTQTR